MMASASHDYHFTYSGIRQAILELQRKGIAPGDSFREVIALADGGLKTKETIFIFRQLAIGLKVHVFIHYFAPHHGHSEVDGHFGSGKRTLRADGNGGPISERSRVVAAFEKLSDTTIPVSSLPMSSISPS